jgi:YhcN/YlaJ family sporulation lipoprotein
LLHPIKRSLGANFQADALILKSAQDLIVSFDEVTDLRSRQGQIVWASGCAVARKPERSTPAPPAGAPSPTAPAPVGLLPAQPAEAHRLATKVATEVQKIPGVNKVAVILTGNTAILGLDIKPEVQKNRTEEIKAETAKKAKQLDKRIRTVMVTTDPDLVTRIKRVFEGVSKGTPITSFTKEVQEILRRIKPAAGNL